MFCETAAVVVAVVGVGVFVGSLVAAFGAEVVVAEVGEVGRWLELLLD